MYIDISGIPINSEYYDDYNYMYYDNKFEFSGEAKVFRQSFSTKNQITFTDLKQNSLDCLFYIIGRNILRNSPYLMDKNMFDVYNKSSYILKAKISLEKDFELNHYLHKSKSSTQDFYINGIRLIKPKKRPLHDYFVFSQEQYDMFFPEQYYEFKFSHWLED